MGDVMKAADADHLMTAILTPQRTEPPYSDYLARELGWSHGRVMAAGAGLRERGLVRQASAPHGVLFYPTMRGADA